MCSVRHLQFAVWFIAITVAQLGYGDDDALRKKRLQLMEQTIADFEISSTEITSRPALTFSAKPLLRYSDPTRGLTESNVLLDASVWRLGATGRPTALVTLEIYRSTTETGELAYEFLSLVDAKFSLVRKSAETVVWDATGSALKLRDLPGAPEPAKVASARLAQMRQLARRFAVRETLQGEQIPCRLLPQPIDRYESIGDNIVDGAIFAFANGTNPETGLVLECGNTGWSYGFVRLSSAEAKMELDGREVATYPFFGEYGRRDGSYTSRTHPIPLTK
jgi:hypothetical protein